MGLHLGHDELGFSLADRGDGALFFESIRVTAAGGWIHVMLPRTLRRTGEPLAVQLRLAGARLEVTTTADFDLEGHRVVLVAALQSAIRRRIALRRLRGTGETRRVSIP